MSKWDDTVGKYYYCKVIDAISNIWQPDNKRKTNTEILLKLLELFKWELINREELPNLIYKIGVLETQQNYYREDRDKLEKINDYLNADLKNIKRIHEAEIIRLKDIIQAKQIQLDKLLETK